MSISSLKYKTYSPNETLFLDTFASNTTLEFLITKHIYIGSSHNNSILHNFKSVEKITFERDFNDELEILSSLTTLKQLVVLNHNYDKFLHLPENLEFLDLNWNYYNEKELCLPESLKDLRINLFNTPLPKILSSSLTMVNDDDEISIENIETILDNYNICNFYSIYLGKNYPEIAKHLKINRHNICLKGFSLIDFI